MSPIASSGSKGPFYEPVQSESAQIGRPLISSANSNVTFETLDETRSKRA
jgi:hypothetical protein